MLQEASVLKTLTDSDLKGPTQVATTWLLNFIVSSLAFFLFIGHCAFLLAAQPASVGQERTGHLQYLFS